MTGDAWPRDWCLPLVRRHLYIWRSSVHLLTAALDCWGSPQWVIHDLRSDRHWRVNQCLLRAPSAASFSQTTWWTSRRGANEGLNAVLLRQGDGRSGILDNQQIWPKIEWLRSVLREGSLAALLSPWIAVLVRLYHFIFVFNCSRVLTFDQDVSYNCRRATSPRVKKYAAIFCDNFIKYWPIFQILSRHTLQEICNKSMLNISPHVKCVATLPCEIFRKLVSCALWHSCWKINSSVWWAATAILYQTYLLQLLLNYGINFRYCL